MNTLLFLLLCVLLAIGTCVATFVAILLVLNRLAKEAIAKGLNL